MQASFKTPKGHPQDYFVPNFGIDHDIKDAQNNIAAQEKRLNHAYHASFKKPEEPPKDYFVPNFGIDQDIKDAQSNIAAQEKIHGAWNPPQDDNGVWDTPTAADNESYTYKSNVQLESDIHLESDPICSSAGCTQYKHPKKEGHPVDYPVPDFGQDRDIKHNFQDLDWAEKKLHHNWEWVKTKPEEPVVYHRGPMDPEI